MLYTEMSCVCCDSLQKNEEKGLRCFFQQKLLLVGDRFCLTAKGEMIMILYVK